MRVGSWVPIIWGVCTPECSFIRAINAPQKNSHLSFFFFLSFYIIYHSTTILRWFMLILLFYSHLAVVFFILSFTCFGLVTSCREVREYNKWRFFPSSVQLQRLMLAFTFWSQWGWTVFDVSPVFSVLRPLQPPRCPKLYLLIDFVCKIGESTLKVWQGWWVGGVNK